MTLQGSFSNKLAGGKRKLLTHIPIKRRSVRVERKATMDQQQGRTKTEWKTHQNNDRVRSAVLYARSKNRNAHVIITAWKYVYSIWEEWNKTMQFNQHHTHTTHKHIQTHKTNRERKRARMAMTLLYIPSVGDVSPLAHIRSFCSSSELMECLCNKLEPAIDLFGSVLLKFCKFNCKDNYIIYYYYWVVGVSSHFKALSKGVGNLCVFYSAPSSFLFEKCASAFLQ